jgi:hypothetical protein
MRIDRLGTRAWVLVASTLVVLSACASSREHAPPLPNEIATGGASSSADAGGDWTTSDAGGSESVETAAGGATGARGGAPSANGGSRNTSGAYGAGGRVSTGSGGTGAGGKASTGGGGTATGGRSGAGGTGTGGAGTGGSAAVPCLPKKTLIGNTASYSAADLEQYRGFTEIQGNVYIGGNVNIAQTDISSLEALGCLETLVGEMTILDSPNLKNLYGLGNLSSAISLKVADLQALETLDGLGHLSLSDTLLVERNPALVSLGRTIVRASQLVILYNPGLTWCETTYFFNSLKNAPLCDCDTFGGCSVPSKDGGL